MQCSHCQWLNRGHSFLLPRCALRKLLVHLLMCLFGNIILYRWIGDTVCCCGRGEVREPAIARRRKWVCRIRARRRQVVRGAPNMLFIIHYLRMRSFKNGRENWSGQNRTSRTACYGHEYKLTHTSESYDILGKLFSNSSLFHDRTLWKSYTQCGVRAEVLLIPQWVKSVSTRA